VEGDILDVVALELPGLRQTLGLESLEQINRYLELKSDQGKIG